MDYYRVCDNFNINPLIEKYQGKTLEELFPSHQIISNRMGEFLEITHKPLNISSNIDLTLSKRNLIKNLKVVPFIGKEIESFLKKRGINTLYDLRHVIRYGKYAKKIIDLVKDQDFKGLSNNQYVYDIDISFCFNLSELLFLDIETLDLYDSPIIIFGYGYFENSSFYIKILFAREISEEIAICEHLKNEILPRFRCFITYNGKSFDIPYLANRFMYYFDSNPMISKDDTPYESLNTLYHHIDLYHNCRRKFKGLFYNYTLTDMEKLILDFQRDHDVPSNLIGFCYRNYLKNPYRYIGPVKECIEHNYYDIYSMPLILNKLLNLE
jgi:uncharacterized protein